MVTRSILPSSGLPPPGLDRAVIPARLRFPVANRPDPQGVQPAQPPQPQPQSAVEKTGGPVPSHNLGGPTAVVVQARESVVHEPRRVSTPLNDTQLSDDDKVELSRLKARDREVRTHEAAHRNAGQGYTSSASYDYVRGPDDRRYAVGGHVKIDTKEVQDDPKATIAKMEVVMRAALAPARPSGQDRAVASAAAAAIREAEAELAKQKSDAAKKEAGSANAEAPRVAINLIA